MDAWGRCVSCGSSSSGQSRKTLVAWGFLAGVITPPCRQFLLPAALRSARTPAVIRVRGLVGATLDTRHSYSTQTRGAV